MKICYNFLNPWVVIVHGICTYVHRVFIYHVFNSIDSVCLRDLARHFKTEPIETVTLCFGYIPENTVALCCSSRFCLGI
jgi:hypothetical protein